MKRLFNYLGERLNKISSLKLTFLAVLSALVVGAFIIVVSDIDNLRDGDIIGALSTVGSAYWALVVGSFGSLRAISNTINSSTPLILCGVSVAIAFKAGLFNIGATGQMLAGVMTALWFGFAMDVPGYIQVPLAIIAGALGGLLGSIGAVFLVGDMAEAVPADRHVAFLVDLWAHSASYLIGLVGGVVMMVRVWRSRGRAVRPPAADKVAS